MPADDVDSLLTLLGTHSEPDSIAEAAAPMASDNSDPLPRTHDDTPHEESAEIPSGEHFISWLRLSVQSRRLVINDAKALVHTVDGTAYLVSPGVFQRYAQEHPQTARRAKLDNLADWQWVQKRFEKLGRHRKQSNGLNIWTCEVKGTRKSRRVHGYLLNQPGDLFSEPMLDNPYLTLENRAPSERESMTPTCYD